MGPSRFYPAVILSALSNLVVWTPVWATEQVFFLGNDTAATNLVEFYTSPETSIGWEDNIVSGQLLVSVTRLDNSRVSQRAEQTEYTFTLMNDTSVDMLEFYASPQMATDWEANILVDKTVGANGDWTTITLAGNRGCLYDFLAVFADGDKLEKYGIDVCELETHTYYEN